MAVCSPVVVGTNFTWNVVEPLGATSLVHLALGESEIVAETRAEDAPALDAPVEVWAEPSALFFFDAEGARVERAAP